MKPPLIVCAFVEAAAGVALVCLPDATVRLLIGVPLDTPGGLVAGRIAGAALFSLGVACWQARNGERGRATMGVVWAMLCYNLGAVAILSYAGLNLRLQGLLLRPAIVGHLGLALWCAASLRIHRSHLSNKEI